MPEMTYLLSDGMFHCHIPRNIYIYADIFAVFFLCEFCNNHWRPKPYSADILYINHADQGGFFSI